MTIHGQHESQDFVVEIQIHSKNAPAHSFLTKKKYDLTSICQRLARDEAKIVQEDFAPPKEKDQQT